MSRLRVVAYGLGPIGLAAAGLALRKRSLEVVGAIDIAPDKVGADLHDLLERPGRSGISVENDAQAVFERARPDAILHCTASFLPLIAEPLIEAALLGIDIVSSAEELLVPDLQHPDLAARIHAAALAGGATVVGTGVNPGFAMDFVAIVCSAVLADVTRVRCVRVVDAGTRRLPLQRKVGAGLTLAQFADRQRGGGFGHIGLRESIALVGRALGFELDTIEHSLQPVLATEERRTRHLTVPAGHVAGIHDTGTGRRDGDAVIELDLAMFVGAPQPRDEVFLSGPPDLHVRFEGGVPGDSATAAILVNTLPQVVAATPGLKTVLDLAPPRLVR